MFGPEGEMVLSDGEVAGLRIFMAGLVMTPIAIRNRTLIFGKQWKPVLATAIFGTAIPAFLFTASEQKLDTSFVGMLNSLVPVFALTMSVVIFKNKLSRLQTIGVAIGLGGAVGLILNGNSFSLTGDYKYVLMVVIATLCYAISLNIYKQYLGGANPIAVSSISFAYLFIPAVIYLATTNAFDTITTHEHGYAAFGYVSLLGVFGTALAVLIFYYMIGMSDAIFASTVTYLIPIVAILWGLIDNEIIPLAQFLFMAVILGGVYLVNRGSQRFAD